MKRLRNDSLFIAPLDEIPNQESVTSQDLVPRTQIRHSFDDPDDDINFSEEECEHSDAPSIKQVMNQGFPVLPFPRVSLPLQPEHRQIVASSSSSVYLPSHTPAVSGSSEALPCLNMAGMPIRPYIFNSSSHNELDDRPIVGDSSLSVTIRPRAREKGISFNGSAMDQDDAKWYLDPPPEPPIPPISAQTLVAAPALSSSLVLGGSSSSSATKRRKLERFSSAEALDTFIKEDTHSSTSGH